MTADRSSKHSSLGFKSEGSDDTDEENKPYNNEITILENDVSNLLMNQKNQAGVDRSNLERALDQIGFMLYESKNRTRKSGVSRSLEGLSRERELLAQLFPQEKSLYTVLPQHFGLPGVLKHAFVAQEVLLRRQSSMPAKIASGSISGLLSFIDFRVKASLCGPRSKQINKLLQKLVSHSMFTFIGLVLTLYTLVCPDLSIMTTDSRADTAFMIANTVIFFVFVLELILIVTARGNYMVTLHFALDLVSVLSLFTDTWFMRSTNFDDKGSSLSRLARSSRVARVARIGRIARVAKLIPRALKACKKQSYALADHLLRRRLWRLFQYLDTDRDGLISVFDAKIFYAALIQECPHVFAVDPSYDLTKILAKDLDRMLNWVPDELRPTLDVDDFCKAFMDMQIGSALKEFHRQDLESDSGSVWALTQRLSDSTAMKVVVGILLLVATMTLLEVEVDDRSVTQGLPLLDFVARLEHRKVSPNGDNICGQIGAYEQYNELMYLYLDGQNHYDYGTCLRPGKAAKSASLIEAVVHSDRLIDEANLRDNEFLRICWQPKRFFDCNGQPPDPNVTASLSLVDLTPKTRNSALWNLMTVLVVLIQIPLSVYMLNSKITAFSSTLLQPLRSLVDDMVAMSSLELVGIDDENPITNQDSKHGFTVAEELANLNNAFRSMRNAIRSWSKFVPPSVVERFYAAGLEATVGVTRMEVTVLFCDIDGFEETCREFRPHVVLAQLTGVLGTIADVIQLHNGTFLEFISDEVLAVFNAPNRLPDHASAGLMCGVSIHEAVADAHAFSMQGNPVRCRVGVHTGLILAGNIGSHQRIKYGLLGDGVNLAARLKGLNSKYCTSTLCTSNTLESQQTALLLATRPVDLVAVKGKTEPTTVHEVLGRTFENPLLEQGSLRHAEAFSLYQARKFEEAKNKFEEANAILEAADREGDQPSMILCQRCEAYIQNPPPPDWDGVERLKAKSFGPSAAGQAQGSVGRASSGQGSPKEPGSSKETATDDAGSKARVAV